MATHNHSSLIASSLMLIYPMYLAGALYVVYPLMAWYLLLQLFVVRLRGNAVVLHPLAITWAFCMFAMLVVLVIGHLDWQLGMAAAIKSSIGWAKGWALLALFVIAGSLLTDRAQLVRAACVVGTWTLVLAPCFLLAATLGLPETLYVSPLKVLGGSSVEYFKISLYELDPGFGIPRLSFFAPWAPAIGLVGNILLLLCFLETNRTQRLQGIAGALVMIALSLSRLGWIIALTIPATLFVITYLRARWLWLTGALACVLFLAVGLQLLELVSGAYDQLKSARPDSTVVRQYLADIAVTRWQDEAPIWGHGQVESGPLLVQYMMIGSHHTWYGLLFVKGVVGAVALAIPLLLTVVTLARHALSCRESRVAFGLICVISLYSIGENLEVLPYLYWPGLIFIGSVLQDKVSTNA